MNSRSVICPHCYNGLDTPESLTGKEVQCPICQKNFVIKFEDVNISGDDIETADSANESGLKIIKKQEYPISAKHNFVLIA